MALVVLVDHLEVKEDLGLVVQEVQEVHLEWEVHLDMEVHLGMEVLQEIKMISWECSNSNRMIQEELLNKEAHIPTKEDLHQDIQMPKEAHHKEDHREDLLKVDHPARLETCLARNDWLCTL